MTSGNEYCRSFFVCRSFKRSLEVELAGLDLAPEAAGEPAGESLSSVDVSINELIESHDDDGVQSR